MPSGLEWIEGETLYAIQLPYESQGSCDSGRRELTAKPDSAMAMQTRRIRKALNRELGESAAKTQQFPTLTAHREVASSQIYGGFSLLRLFVAPSFFLFLVFVLQFLVLLGHLNDVRLQIAIDTFPTCDTGQRSSQSTTLRELGASQQDTGSRRTCISRLGRVRSLIGRVVCVF